MRPRELPTCVPVRPVVLLAAVRGALGRRDGAAVEVARSLRDHRDDLADHVVTDLLRVFDVGFASGLWTRADTEFWAPALSELRRPSLSQRARARQAQAERTNP